MKFFIAFAAFVAVAVARPGSNVWSLDEVSQALQNPNVDQALVPYLEAALDAIMDALYAGQQVHSVYIPLPAHLANPRPEPVAVLEPEHVVESAPENPAPASGSPLVQIIVNVNNKPQEVPIPEPVSIPEPIAIPVQIIDEIPVAPEAVIEPEVSPIDVIAINPIVPVPAPVEEVEVEAVPRPEINPIDIVAVHPVESWGPDGLLPSNAIDVGPM